MPRHPPYALHSLSPHTQTQQKQDTQPTQKRKGRNVLSKTATKMLASTIQQPNNHKKTSRTPTIRRRDLRGRLIPQGPTVRHPTHQKTGRHPSPGPAARSTPAPLQAGAHVVLNTADPTNGVNMSTIPLVSTPMPAGQTPTARSQMNGWVCAP